MYVGSDGRVRAQRPWTSYFTLAEMKRLFWQLVDIVVLLFVESPDGSSPPSSGFWLW